jgi:hypothetical protein
VINPLARLPVVPRLRPKNIRDKRLRIAIVKREPTGLHLHHYPVPGQKNVVGGWQCEAIEQRNVGGYWFGDRKALTITAAENVALNHKLITAHVWLARDLIGIKVNHLDDPIRVGAARGGD